MLLCNTVDVSILLCYYPDMRKGSTSKYYRTERNAMFYRLFREAGLNLGEIARNPNYNKDGISKQRIHKIIQEFEQRMDRLG